MPNINIAVRKKIAKNVDGTEYICGNSDFLIDFDFDAEWDAYEAKTARFIYGTAYQDVVFQGTQCKVPVMSNTNTVLCGVFAGDLLTTTPALIKAQKSILCNSGTPVEPEPDTYAQMMTLFNESVAEVRKHAETVTSASENAGKSESNAKKSEEAAVKSASEAAESAASAKRNVEEALRQAKESGEFDGSRGEKGDPYTLNDTDKAEIVDAVLSALPKAEEVSF